MTTTAISPTWTWGSSARLEFSGAGDGSFKTSAQLAQVSLPEPAVCSVYLQASAQLTNPESCYVGTFTVNFAQGLGRVTVPRQMSFSSQPGPDSPLELTIPFLPIHALQVDVSANLIGAITGTNSIQVFLVISPITRIPQQIQKLQFGMALPGEADALDDELRNDLEGESPTVSETMLREADQRVHGEADEEEEEEPPERAPAWMLDIVDRLTARLGRPPRRQELMQAISRYQARASRRAR